MTTSIGFHDLSHVIRIHGPWDPAYFAKWALADGTTYDNVITEIGTALTMWNAALTQGYWAQFLSVTSDLSIEYDVGGGGPMPVMSEYSVPDPVRAEGTGHMLPFKDYGDGLAWTYLALKRMNMNSIRRGIRRMFERANSRYHLQILTRAFHDTVDNVGATGKSVPWADGGTADAAYIPYSYDGKNFASSHDHFLRHTNDGAGRLAAATAMADHLVEHGHMAPWDLVIPKVDEAAWSAVTGFAKPERSPLSTAGVEVRGIIPDESYIGLLEIPAGWFRVRTENRIPTNYAGAFKPAGFNAVTSPLVARTEDGQLQMYLVTPTPGNFPLQDAYIHFAFGIGVRERTAAVVAHFAASGGYVNPTISV